MRLDLDRPTGINIVRAVAPGEILVGDRVIRTSVIIAATAMIPAWPVSSTRDIDELSLAPAMDLRPDILLLGTGSVLTFPDQEVHASVLSRNIGLEVMATAAACRTYNILAAEGRNVVAALILG